MALTFIHSERLVQRGFQYVEQLGNRSCLAVVPSFVMFLVNGADNFGEASGAIGVKSVQAYAKQR